MRTPSRQFRALGYRRASLRAIAAEAGVDQRLVAHFFGSKQELFAAVVVLPFEPAIAFDQLHAAGEAGVGRRLAEFVLSILESSEGRRTLTGLIRAAASEEQAADLIRELVTHHLLTPLAERVGSDHPDLRASLIASQIVGRAMTRHIVGLDPVVSAPLELWSARWLPSSSTTSTANSTTRSPTLECCTIDLTADPDSEAASRRVRSARGWTSPPGPTRSR